MRRGDRWRLAAILAIEAAAFGIASDRFLTGANAADILRLSAELGLLSLALTCVIVTGGIDLSVGSLMGFSAVLFGWLVIDRGVSPFVASVVVLAAGTLGGLLNGLVITRLRALPLIVTLGTYSLFRGLAEGLTGGVRNFTGFPASFTFLGQGSWFGVPAQTPVPIAAIVAYGVLLHRSVFGRALYAIGHSPDAARHSGIRVDRRLLVIYSLSGLTSALAGLIYVARVGQGKADAGTGAELLAITAVVLGGTSILGGVGTIAGSLLGLLIIVFLQDGLRLAALPTELAGILTGGILIAAIAAERLSPERAAREPRRRGRRVAVAAIALAGIVLGVHAVVGNARGHRTITVAMMPKAKGDPYFVSCRKGAEDAARELGLNLIWDGPTDLDPARQNDIVESWITRGVDVIAVSVENRAALSTTLRKARLRGIPVITWDADAEADARDFFVNQATPEGIGDVIADQTAEILGDQGSFAIITGALTAANQNEWIKYIKARMADRHPRVTLDVIRPSDDDRDKAFAETQTVLRVYPQVRAIAAISAPAVPGAAEAVRQSGRTDVRVTGLSLPSLCKPYVHSGTAYSVVLWDTNSLGYLTVRVADAIRTGALRRGVTRLAAGRLGSVDVRGDQVILGAPFVFTAKNIDRFDF
jgi:rhamnose transport system substrate-binding protein